MTAIDTRAAIPPLDVYERGVVADRKTAERQRLAPLAQQVRAEHSNTLLATLSKQHPPSRAQRILAQYYRGCLTPSIELDTDDFGIVSVADVLADPERFVDATLADPYEGVAYGRCKAKIMRGRDGTSLLIHSFAHGNGIYYLRHDYSSATGALKQSLSGAAEGSSDPTQIMAALCEIDAAAELEIDERHLLIEQAAKLSGIEMPVIRQRLEHAAQQRAQAERQAAADAQAADTVGERLRRDAIPKDAELTPVVIELDGVLGADPAAVPPMRSRDGHLVRLAVESSHSLHELTATSANAAAQPGEAAPAAPAEPALRWMSPVEVSLLVEHYFAWSKKDRHGNHAYDVQLPPGFIAALMEFPIERSKLPIVQQVNTTPLILFNGDVLAGSGLDRNNGILHFIDPMVDDAVPRSDVSQAEARDAVQFLVNDWLGDVLTTDGDAGRLTAILLAVTLIQRVLFDERPAFLIGAGKAGTGKTTLINMVCAAVLGRRASATNWSPRQEERRKALFAALLEGTAALVWDNIGSGTIINCPSIARALTAAHVSDRVLGVSRTARADASAIQIFTGNAISVAGDLVGRTRSIVLHSDAPRPADRAVLHFDPVNWTQVHRPQILRALYSLLIYAARNRPDRQIPQTRMRGWWSLAGYAIEVAGGLLAAPVSYSCVAQDKALEAVDPEGALVLSVLRLILQTFAERPFTAREIADLIDGRVNLPIADLSPTATGEERLQHARGRGVEFAEALGALLSNRAKLRLSAIVIGRVLVERVANQAHYLDAAWTASIILKIGQNRTNTIQFIPQVTQYSKAENGPIEFSPALESTRTSPSSPAYTAPVQPNGGGDAGDDGDVRVDSNAGENKNPPQPGPTNGGLNRHPNKYDYSLPPPWGRPNGRGAPPLALDRHRGGGQFQRR